MKICTITCHDVYNYGASLQSYSLMKYLSNCGHNVEIIDYKPAYLSNHYKLLRINNRKWKRNLFMKLIYLIIKAPGRIRGLKRKKAFDQFTAHFLNTTKTRYHSNNELKVNFPDADVYICGSDQIWNTLHPNGKDPAFYLDFVPVDKIKASYAASFATEVIQEQYKSMVKEKVKRLDGVGIREKSGVEILRGLNINNAVNLVDPVFLLNKVEWDLIGSKDFNEDYILVYDFDDSNLIKEIALSISEKKGYKIYSVNPGKLKYANKYYIYDGPETFVSLIKNAQFVIANSYHAAVFSIIYEKNFVIVNRKESINIRMKDLLEDLKLHNRLVDKDYNLSQLLSEIDYAVTRDILNEKIRFSKNYLFEILGLKDRRNIL